MDEQKLARYHKPFDGVGLSQSIYKLEPPLKYEEFTGGDWSEQETEYILISSSSMCGMETYIFPADRSGVVTDWGELNGSVKGYVQAEDILESIGYTLVEHKCTSCGHLLETGACTHCCAPQ